MQEKTCKRTKKTLRFEETGETFSLEISLENVSPSTKKDAVIRVLNTLFERVLKEIRF